jgi:hypothetical protein
MATQIINAIDGGAGAGLCVMYSGTRPASVATGLSGNTLLAKLVFNDPCGTSASGVLTFDADPVIQDTSADAGSPTTATWFRVYSSADGSTVSEANAVADGDIGTSGSDLNLVSTSITATQPIQITAWTLTMPGA